MRCPQQPAAWLCRACYEGLQHCSGESDVPLGDLIHIFCGVAEVTRGADSRGVYRHPQFDDFPQPGIEDVRDAREDLRRWIVWAAMREFEVAEALSGLDTVLDGILDDEGGGA